MTLTDLPKEAAHWLTQLAICDNRTLMNEIAELAMQEAKKRGWIGDYDPLGWLDATSKGE